MVGPAHYRMRRCAKIGAVLGTPGTPCGYDLFAASHRRCDSIAREITNGRNSTRGENTGRSEFIPAFARTLTKAFSERRNLSSNSRPLDSRHVETARYARLLRFSLRLAP